MPELSPDEPSIAGADAGGRKAVARLAVLASRGVVDKIAAVDRLWEIAIVPALARAVGEDRVQANHIRSICRYASGGGMIHVCARGAGLGDRHGDLLVAMLLKRQFSEQGAGYPDKADRPLRIAANTEGGSVLRVGARLVRIDLCLDTSPELHSRARQSHGGRVWIPVAHRLSEPVLVASRVCVAAGDGRS
jgi:hypothetical protein